MLVQLFLKKQVSEYRFVTPAVISVSEETTAAAVRSLGDAIQLVPAEETTKILRATTSISVSKINKAPLGAESEEESEDTYQTVTVHAISPSESELAGVLKQILNQAGIEELPANVSISEILKDGVELMTGNKVVVLKGEICEEQDLPITEVHQLLEKEKGIRGQDVKTTSTAFTKGGAAPQFVVLPKPVTVKEGKSICLRCQVSG